MIRRRRAINRCWITTQEAMVDWEERTTKYAKGAKKQAKHFRGFLRIS